MSVLYTLEDIRFQYRLGKQDFPALRGVDLLIPRHEFICMSGPSGSGKSTLLNLLGLIEAPQKGRLEFCGKNLKSLSEAEKNQIRKFEIGFVFQSFHLFPVLSAEENVAYFLTRQGIRSKERTLRVRKALESVGLWEHRKKRPLEMSGGQRQRVAIARAIAKKPEVIIADEPTASLDQDTGKEIMDVFVRLHQELGTTLILSSHDPMVQERCPTRLHLVDGKIRAVTAQNTLERDLESLLKERRVEEGRSQTTPLPSSISEGQSSKTPLPSAPSLPSSTLDTAVSAQPETDAKLGQTAPPESEQLEEDRFGELNTYLDLAHLNLTQELQMSDDFSMETLQQPTPSPKKPTSSEPLQGTTPAQPSDGSEAQTSATSWQTKDPASNALGRILT